MSAAILSASDVVVLSAESVQSKDDDDVVQFNVSFVNELLRQLLRMSEISHDALTSYYVDYYLAQVENGGFAQFVYNTNWNARIVMLVKEGLAAMRAKRHLALFEKGEWLVSNEPSKLRRFLSGEFFGVNPERDRFDAITNQFYALNKRENLTKLNAAWLKSRPGSCVVPMENIRQEIQRRASAIADRPARQAEALAKAPRITKLIHALCEEAGHKLDRITMGDPRHEHEGRRCMAWHFLTDKGQHYMVESGGKAIMFEDERHERVTEIPAKPAGAI
ncbi:DMP19 family protein [Variovorax sp. ZS18.2.2]|uniref:DMP19 family protein n=1 Tax=Variovorax sp. ZS18.2.2 TaxID=2971255 RepID=UPI002150B0EE|nr:DMP19 family protein [Variovorax sp. ZS18.2.2]MCR6477008.1 DMP19 family protein [Variovorax sp. ZS18.2.2]